jgi:nickel/cobalt exporter
MPDLAEILRAGGNVWLYLPVAVLLGALHGLEPGHSKTMMAAYIVAIRGTIGQAVLLGVCAALSHSLVVWGVAALGLSLGRNIIDERLEAWLLVASGLIILAVALWMLIGVARSLGWLRTRVAARQAHALAHTHHHEHVHDHPRADSRLDRHGGHRHGRERPSAAGHQHADMDRHEREHAAALARQVAGQHVTNGQIALFGLSGGLIPCPASITVLLICLQLGQFTLGMATVAAFSLGLAITLVGIGVAAAWSVRQASHRLRFPARLLRMLPLASIAVVASIGIYMLGDGVFQLRSG